MIVLSSLYISTLFHTNILSISCVVPVAMCGMHFNLHMPLFDCIV
jgi:hypothetical protein